jgi:hypothetical protein
LRNCHDEIKPSTQAQFNIFESWDKFPELSKEVRNDDLAILITAREGTISHHHALEQLPKVLSRHYENKNFIILYPEQKILWE